MNEKNVAAIPDDISGVEGVNNQQFNTEQQIENLKMQLTTEVSETLPYHRTMSNKYHLK